LARLGDEQWKNNNALKPRPGQREIVCFQMSSSCRRDPSGHLFERIVHHCASGRHDCGYLFAEVVVCCVYFMEPLPYYQTTLIDAGIMTVLIFPVLYYFSFRPLIRQMQKSWEAEESLRRSRELQEKFFDSIGTLIAYMDCDFHFIHVNGPCGADGHTPDYFIGKNHFDLYPHPENEAIFRGVVESGEPFSVFEKPFEYPENPEREVTYRDWSLQPVKGSNGIVEGLVLSLVDVTERRRAQEKIHQLSRVVEQTEDTVVVTDCDGVIEYVNRL
jgi:PAS domain S-box-containing protein